MLAPSGWFSDWGTERTEPVHDISTQLARCAKYRRCVSCTGCQHRDDARDSKLVPPRDDLNSSNVSDEVTRQMDQTHRPPSTRTMGLPVLVMEISEANRLPAMSVATLRAERTADRGEAILAIGA